MAITIDHLFKRFGEYLAVDDVSTRIEDGEFFVLLGPSGCGKTTTLRMIAGLELPSDGRIAINGVDVTYLEPRSRDIAMVFQDYGLYPHLSVFENIAFPLKLRKVPAPERRRKVEETAELLGIGELLARRPAQISGGQRQRVSLARALVRNPKVFLMDEPLSNLDAKLRVTMRTEIKRLVTRLGITTVYVTHDQTEAMAMADRIAVMNRGKMIQVGAPLEVYDRPAHRFVAEFIGSPPMNLLPAHFNGNGRLQTDPQCIGELVGHEHHAMEAAARGTGHLLLGIRPEHIALGPATPGEPTSPGCGPALVEVIEPLGPQTYVYLRAGSAQFVAVTDRVSFSVGDTVRFRIAPDRVHVIHER